MKNTKIIIRYIGEYKFNSKTMSSARLFFENPETKTYRD